LELRNGGGNTGGDFIMARPGKLDSKIIIRICNGILTGATYKAACTAAGISYDTFNEWRKGAELARKKERRTENDDLLIQFSDAVEKANAKLEINLMKGIKQKGEKDWKALAWILQNRFPESYAEKKQHDHNVVLWDHKAWEEDRKKRLEQVEEIEE